MRKPLKALGAAGLAAATVVSGLSLGPAAAQATTERKAEITSTLSGKLVLLDRGNYFAIDSQRNGTYFPASNLPGAIAAASSWTIPASGSTGVVRNASGSCLSFTSRASDQQQAPTFMTSCSSAKQWTHSAGKLRNGNDYLDLEMSSGPLEVSGWQSASTVVTGSHLMPPTTALTATVQSQDDRARTAVIGGRATPGARVEIGLRFVTANTSNGEWSMAVSDLDVGTNPFTVVQRVNSQFVDQRTVTVTVQASDEDLVAQVDKTNNIAKSAEISGTATPGATIKVGNQEVPADSTTGAWSMTVSNLNLGANTIRVTQFIDGEEADFRDLSATIVEGGTIVATDAGPIELDRGGMTDVPFIVKNNETRSNMNGTVTLDAPAGTTFAEGQTTVAASYRSGESGSWRNYARLDLRDGVRSDDGKQMTFTVDTDGGNMVNGEYYRYILEVDAPANAAGGTGEMSFVYRGDSSKGDYRAEGATSTTIETGVEDLTAQVDKTNNIAKSAEISGTATPGATIKVGNQEVPADETTGAWSMIVEGLEVGDNTFTVVQIVDGNEEGEQELSVTIVDGGTLVGIDQGPIDLPRGESTQVPFVVENRETRSAVDGTVTVDAPEGTTFDDQDTVQGAWRNVGESTWNEVDAIPLTNGRVSDDGKKITFDADWAGQRNSPEQYRFMLGVTADENAPDGTSTMDFVFSGTSSKGDYRATGSTATSIERAETPDPAPLIVETPTNGQVVDTNRPVFSGTGDEGATIEIRGTSRVVATATVVDGKWTATSTTDLRDGSYALTATQTPLQGATSQAPVNFRIATNPLTTELTATGAFDEDVTKPATISGNATSGATVIVKDSLNNEIGRTIAVDGRYTIPVPPASAHFGVNDFTVTQSKNGTTSPAKDVSLDYGNPAPIRISTPANGDTVAKQGLTFTGTGDNGARIDIRGSVRAIATGTVTGGAWTAPVTVDLANNVYALRAVQTTKGGLTTTAPITITIIDEAPIVDLTATAAFNITDENLPAAITGRANPGATVTVKDSEGKTVDTAVATNGSYSITIPPSKAHFGVNEFTITQTVRGQVSAPLERNLDYGNPAAPVIQTPDNGATVTNGSIRFTGIGATGAKLDMRGNFSSVGATKVADGEWAVDVERQLTPNVYALHALQTSKGGLTKRADITVTVRNEQITELTANGAFHATDVEQNATVSGNAQTGADVIVKEGTRIVESVKAVGGKYSVSIPATTSGVRTFTVTQTVNGKVSEAKTATLDYGTPAEMVIETPADGATVRADQVIFTGKGEVGAKVVLNGTVSRLGDATVNGGRDWTIVVSRTLTPQLYTLFTKQISKGNLHSTTDQRTINVIR